jgi:hypothetical protein
MFLLLSRPYSQGGSSSGFIVEGDRGVCRVCG